jgi:hypothetical protein
MRERLSFCLILSLLVGTTSLASDWPQFLGPTRNGVYEGSDLAVAIEVTTALGAYLLAIPPD